MRHVKQLIYGIFYLAFWAALIAGIYNLQKPAPSCFDNRQNQNETGVDCGGICARVCIPDAIVPIEIVGTPKLIPLVLDATASSTVTRFSLVAQVQNRNSDFAARNFEYTFEVYDQAGVSLGSFSDRSFVYAGEIKYLSILNQSLPVGSLPAYAKFTAKDPSWTPAINFPRPKISIRTLNTSEANGNLVSQGILVNQDNVDFQTVYLTALFYDANGQIIGVSATERNNVTAGESREFSLFYPVIPNVIMDKTQVFLATPNPR